MPLDILTVLGGTATAATLAQLGFTFSQTSSKKKKKKNKNQETNSEYLSKKVSKPFVLSNIIQKKIQTLSIFCCVVFLSFSTFVFSRI